jgi:hypothetical protein
MTSTQEETFKKVLKSHSIDYIEEHFVNYVADRNMSMLDDQHPCLESGAIYAEDVIFKKIKTLGWI